MANVNLNELGQNLSSQFKDLNGVHPGLWPLAPRLLTSILLCGLVIFFGWYFYGSDRQAELDQGQKEEEKLKDEYKVKMQKAISLDALKEQRKLVQQYVSTMEKQLPSKSEMDALLFDINQASLGQGLHFDSFKPGSVVAKDYYAELPIEIKLSGSYHEIGQFVSSIAKLSRIVTLNNLSITSPKDAGKDSALVLEVVAKTFRYLDPDEVAQQVALNKGKKK